MTKTKNKSESFSIRLTPDAMYLLNELMQKFGLNRPAVLELSLRELARVNNVEIKNESKISN